MENGLRDYAKINTQAADEKFIFANEFHSRWSKVITVGNLGISWVSIVGELVGIPKLKPHSSMY